MPKIIVTSRYIKPNAHKKFGNYIKYIATREGVEKPIPKPKVNRELDREIFINYLDSRPNSHGLFSETDKPIVLDKVAKEVANNEGAIWTHIVSLKREDAERMGYTDLGHWRDLVRRHIVDIAEAQKIAPEDIRWYAAFHNKERILTNEKYTGDALLQKTYVTDCITKKSRKNNGELPMYLVKNHHDPIISRADFNRVQEEMARRGAKRAIADKLTKTEMGKYSAKYALSELLICGECGTHYRRVTWTAKGVKEIKWRCINRIQYGKKKCHNSPTVDEQALHKAIVSAINEFCEVKDDVATVLRESITEVLDPNLNGSVQAAQQRIDELAHNIDELIKLATVPETAESAMSDIARFSEEMKTLREFIETEKAKLMTAQRGSAELDAILKRLENEDFTLTEYDDVAVRQLIEKVTVENKSTITVTFKGGFEVRKELNGN